MKILFYDLDTGKEHLATSISDCRTGTESELWRMHEQIESPEWKLGRTLANRIA